MRKNRERLIAGIIVAIVLIVGFTAFYHGSFNKSSNNITTKPLPVTGPNTTGFTFLYQIDNIHGSNCFHFNLPKDKISSLFFVDFFNNTVQGDCIIVYNSTHCYFDKFNMQPDENVISSQQFNISDIYSGIWSVNIAFSSSSQAGNYHFFVYYKTGGGS